MVQSVASAALAFFGYQLWFFLNVTCASIEMPSMCVTWVWDYLNLISTLVFVVSFGRRCFCLLLFNHTVLTLIGV
jgi:hypothetical protein